ncbi:aldehyde dehydrogenase family protein [Sneathiella chungangensis]|uniref:Aldehyde dehydrogenase family protein n=1 Tax=Sneathiella chungangensis TaxID=1418234 RepID=A0A845MGD1_9PROT|nr:aldehyde dehydrogenase family protein [Sneathiella chungangensis]MZR22731.1 aldehyde dehydrogenase family protein [Sneathiella chungangensis]
MEFKNFIDGSWEIGTDTTTNINPSDRFDTIGIAARSHAEQVNQAIDSAFEAASSWANTTPQQRFDILDFVGTEILARREEIGRLLSREEGKILTEGIGEVARAGQIFKFFAGEALRSNGDHLPSVRPGVDIDVIRQPLGVVGLITPWNFPIAIPAWKIAPALAYGNTVVFKPAELVPGCAYVLAEILSRSGLPDGVFNLVIGKGSVIGPQLIENKKISAISFTGSVPTGKSIAADCGARLKKVQLEMGGKNPMIVLDDADLDVAVEACLNGAFFSTGQRCTASSRLIVTEGIHDRFVSTLSDRMSKLIVGHALESTTQMGPVAEVSQLNQNLDYIEVARSEGGNVQGGERLSRDTDGYFMAPALITETNNNNRINREEVFGPIASVIRARDYEEALTIANDTPFGLAAGICTQSLKFASHFKKFSQAGMVMVNLPTAGVDYHVPFGGIKGSSFGAREQGTYAAEFYTSVKTAYVMP